MGIKEAAKQCHDLTAGLERKKMPYCHDYTPAPAYIDFLPDLDADDDENAPAAFNED